MRGTRRLGRIVGVVLGLGLAGALGRGACAKDAPEPGEPPALADRAKILAIELRRGPAKDLEPYLTAAAHPALRAQAIRALGRIGDRAGAPEAIVGVLVGSPADRVLALQAAGLNAAKWLEASVTPYVKDASPVVAAAAVEALGWIGGDGVVPALTLALHHPRPEVVAAALDGLARARPEGLLERVLQFSNGPNVEVNTSAWFAAWMLAGARRKAATSLGGEWRGEPGLVTELVRRGGGPILDLTRVVGILAPVGDMNSSTDAVLRDVRGLLDLIRPAEGRWERGAQEVIARIVATRGGDTVDRILLHLPPLPDPVTRQELIDAIAARDRAPFLVDQVIKEWPLVEPDARVREALAIAICKLGDEAAAQAILARKDRPTDATLRALTEARVLGASKRETAPEELVALALAHPDRPAVLLEACSLLEEKPGAPATKLIDTCLEHADGFVRAAAAGLVGKHKLVDHLPHLDRLLDVDYSHAQGDVRQAVIEAWIELLKAKAVADGAADTLRSRIRQAANTDPSFTARAAARDEGGTLGIHPRTVDDPLQPNDWKGLPRPKEPILGVDLTQGEGPLTEAEILTLADRMRVDRPEFIVESDVGSFRLAIDPTEAPVHAVSFLLCVASGVYEGTPWHRVVPSFVIQGGDPHGTGSGDAGWHLPDEITRARFVRGALGMPKGAIRDTGGCQLFVMHSDYRPLDGRYTCYGHVVDGMDTVDRIRVGDRIRRVGMVLK